MSANKLFDATRIPPDMTPDETGEPWTVVVVPAKEPYLMLHPKDLLKKLTKFLMGEGKSLVDVQALFTTHAAQPMGLLNPIIRAVGEILEKTAKPSGDSSAYRRLRTFSAVMPTPMEKKVWRTGWNKPV